MPSTFPASGKKFVANAVKDMASTIYVAMGNGSAAWGSDPEAAGAGATGLTAEVGRMKAAEVSYVTPDNAGTIQTDLGNFTTSINPTNYLYIRGAFLKAHAVGQTIREAGVFGGCVPPGGAGANDFIAPANMLNTGTLMAVSRFAPFTRLATESQTFEFVVEL